MFFKKYKYYILVSVLLIVGFLFYRKYQAKKKLSTLAPATAIKSVPGTGTSAPKPGDDFPLVKGSSGSNVIYLQRQLNKINPKNPIATDGVFGSDTYNKILLTLNSTYYPVTREKWVLVMQQ